MESFKKYLGIQGETYHQNKHHLNSVIWHYVNKVRFKTFKRDIKPNAVVLKFGVGTGWNFSGLNWA